MIRIEQAVIGPGGSIKHSPGFLPEWCDDAAALCERYGAPQSPFQDATFACRFAKDRVAVVRVVDAPLRFRILILSQTDYEALASDPFLIDDRFPIPSESSDCPTLEWGTEPPPARTVEEVQRVLKRPESAWFFGGVQALIDGGKLALQRPAPEPSMVRDLWSLLPYSSRAELWPATFSPSNQVEFDVVVTPHQPPPHYLREDQAENYPEGRFELNLRIAADNGDQDEVDRLFHRRSRRQTWRLGLVLLVASLILMVLSNLLMSRR